MSGKGKQLKLNSNASVQVNPGDKESVEEEKYSMEDFNVHTLTEQEKEARKANSQTTASTVTEETGAMMPLL